MDSYALETLGSAFVEQYYALFDSDRAGVARLFYDDNSCLTFEGQKIIGPISIGEKLTSLPFSHCKHFISTVDCQASGPAGGLFVLVSGSLQLPGEDYMLRFSQVLLSLSLFTLLMT